MSARPRAAAAALVALTLLGACASSVAPSASPTPTPTYWCTPFPTPGVPQGTPVPCKDYQASFNAAQHAREAEAKAAYEKFFYEFARVEEAGGSAEPPPVILETTDGLFQQLIVGMLRDQTTIGYRAEGNAPRLKIGIDRSRYIEGSEAALMTCEDATGRFYVNKDGAREREGGKVVTIAYLRRVEGRMKIFANEYAQDTPCPFE